MNEIALRTRSRIEVVAITNQVREIVKASGIKEGVCTVFSPHTTAGLIINEDADPDVAADILSKMNKLVPTDDEYRHVEGNSDAHIKTALVNTSLQIIVENGDLCFGTWQGIFFCEFDGPRNRKVWVQITS